MQPGVRLAEVVGSLSLATGLCTGQPIEHGLRRSLLAVWLGEELGLGAAELSETNRRVWAALPGDGIVLDTEGAVWTPGWTETGPACLRVAEGGELLDTVPLDRAGFACTLGGEDGRILICARGGTGECRTASRTTSRA
jgi:sugar lactone lactonase YvrE